VIRITAEELNALAKVMREHQIVDLASGDTRIIMSVNATIPLPGAPVDPMRPIKPASTSPVDLQDLSDEDEELLYASTT
jgi:hypothetical protein